MSLPVVAGRAPLRPGLDPTDGPLVDTCGRGADHRSARGVLRGGGIDEDVADLLRAAAWTKLPGGVNDSDFIQPARPLSKIRG